MLNELPTANAQHADRCLVWGGYGWGNTGDDLTLAIALQDLRKAHGSQMSLLTPKPGHTSQAHPGVPLVGAPWDLPQPIIERCLWKLGDHAASRGPTDSWAARWYRLALRFHRWHPTEWNWHEAFTSASGLHLVGGGYLTDFFNLHYMLRPIRVARAMGLLIRTSPIGIGPFRDAGAARAVARALQGAEVVVRDEASLEFCRTHGLRAEVRPDDGYRLGEVIDAAAITGRDRNAPPAIGVCIFRQFESGWSPQVEQWWVDGLRALVRAFPRWAIQGFCFHTDRELDFAITRQLFARAGLDPDAVQTPHSDYRAAVGSLRQFKAIVSTRFHAVVAASVFEIPCVAVAGNEYYEIKMRSAVRQARHPIALLDPAHAPPEVMIRHFQALLGNDVASGCHSPQ